MALFAALAEPSLSENERATVQRERAAMNETRLTVCAAVLVPLSAAIVAVFSTGENPSAHAEVVVRLQLVMGLLALSHLAGFFTRRRVGRPMPSWIADVASVVVVLYGAGISLSGTRVGGNMLTFPAALFTVSALLRPSRFAGLVAFFGVPAVVIGGVLALHGPSGKSVVWSATALGMALVTWVTNRVLLVSHARDAHQRAMGSVYRGYDRVLGKEVALKLLSAGGNDPSVLHRFLDEVVAAANVKHPGVVAPLHVDLTRSGSVYQVLELIDGVELSRLQVPLPVAAVARIGGELASALAAAHAANVVHRDVKTGNVMVTREAPGVRLLDFGIAKLQQEGRGQLTRDGDVVGTPTSMAPEQIENPRSVGPPADVYALGVLLIELAKSVSPFARESLTQTILAHLKEAAPSLGVHPVLDALVSGCLAKRPEDRPPMRECAQRLQALANELNAADVWALELPVIDALAALTAPTARAWASTFRRCGVHHADPTGESVLSRAGATPAFRRVHSAAPCASSFLPSIASARCSSRTCTCSTAARATAGSSTPATGPSGCSCSPSCAAPGSSPPI